MNTFRTLTLLETPRTYCGAIEGTSLSGRVKPTIGAWAFGVLLVLCSTLNLPAQPGAMHGPWDPEHHARPNMMKFKGLHDQLRVWAQKEIIPTVREWKLSFDKQISAGDLQRLNEMRNSGQQLRKQRETLSQSIRAKEEALSPEDAKKETPELDQLHEQMRSLNQKGRDLLSEVKKLADRYPNELKSLGEQAKPQLKIWMGSAMQQARDYATANKVDMGMFRPEWLHRAVPNLLGIENNPFRKMAVARFLLWDGADLPELNEQQNLEQLAPPPQNKISSNLSFSLGQNVPNPVVGAATTINFSLQQADHVKISLFDANGAELAVICDRNYPAGSNVVEYPVAALSAGTYTYRLVCSQGTLSNTMTIVR